MFNTLTKAVPVRKDLMYSIHQFFDLVHQQTVIKEGQCNEESSNNSRSKC